MEENIKNHYVCMGVCKGVSRKPGVCQTSECPKHGEPLVECNCKDGNHEGVTEIEGEI